MVVSSASTFRCPSLTNAPTTIAINDLLTDISRCEVSAGIPP